MDELFKQYPFIAPPPVVADNPLLVALPLATLILSAGIFSTTFTVFHDTLRHVRLWLAPPCCLLFIVGAYPKGVDPNSVTLVHEAGFLGFLKAWDVLITGFWDRVEDTPRWVALQWPTRERGLGEVGRLRLPLPTTMLGRLAYTVDSLFTVRGSSFFKDCAWDWAPKEVYSYRAGGYFGFIKKRLPRVVMDLICVDVLMAAILAHDWGIDAPRPLTGAGMPLPMQLFYVVVNGLFMYVAIFCQVHIYILLAVLLLRLNPDSFSDSWNDPLRATSLADFWSFRWHQVFRRWYDRATLPLVEIFRPIVNRSTVKFIRIFLIFGITTVYHLSIPLSLEFRKDKLQFWEPSALWFFASQPVVLVVEYFIVQPATERLPETWKIVARRTFLWSWFLWSGRWFCDSYLRYGLFQRRQDLPLSRYVYARTQGKLA